MDVGPETSEMPVTLRIVPFRPGRRPTDEASYPGLGSSDCAAVRVAGDVEANRAYVLFEVGGMLDGLEVDATIRFAPTAHDNGELLAGWDHRPIALVSATPMRTQEVHFHPERDISGARATSSTASCAEPW